MKLKNGKISIDAFCFLAICVGVRYVAVGTVLGKYGAIFEEVGLFQSS